MNELVTGLGLSQPGISKHLRILTEPLFHPIHEAYQGGTGPRSQEPWTG